MKDHIKYDACSLPAVPSLEEVPDISFQCPVESVRVKLQQTLSGVGKVSRMGPVQVTEVDEKPGALLVRWEEVCCICLYSVESHRNVAHYRCIDWLTVFILHNKI